MSRNTAGQQVGGKGTWRRKPKKVDSSADKEATKVWATLLQKGCRDVGPIDTASIIVKGEDEAYSFSQPHLALDYKAHTYALRGKPDKKPLAEVLTEMIGSQLKNFNLNKDDEQSKEDDLGDVPDVDFANVSEEKPSEEAAPAPEPEI